jgi:hypothetical protein
MKDRVIKRVGVFFLSHRPGVGRTKIALDGGGAVYVRVHQEDHVTLSDALAMGEQAPDENLMNSHRLPVRR